MKREGHGICNWCDEPILPGEDISPVSLNGGPIHAECGLRMVAGGANHIFKVCTCCGGTLPPDPEGLTKREAALWAMTAWRWVRELQEVIQRHRARPTGEKKPGTRPGSEGTGSA